MPVTPNDLQASLGLSTGAPPTAVTTRVLAGVTGAWEDATDSVPFVYGTRWTANADGAVATMRVYLKTRQYDGKTLTVALYSDAGALLRSGTKAITSAVPIGWVDVPLSSSVAVVKGTAYRAVMHCPLGNDNAAHVAKQDAGWGSYTATGVVLASAAGGNGWYGYNATAIRNAETADGYQNMYGVDVSVVTQQASANSGARLPVIAYYDDANAATVARPTGDPLVAVLWFNATGVKYPTNAVANIDKVWTL